MIVAAALLVVAAESVACPEDDQTGIALEGIDGGRAPVRGGERGVRRGAIGLILTGIVFAPGGIARFPVGDGFDRLQQLIGFAAALED